MRDKDGRFPENAVPGGKTKSGETLYIARVEYKNCLIIGKVHPSHECAYFPFEDEIKMTEYEVLVIEQNFLLENDFNYLF